MLNVKALDGLLVKNKLCFFVDNFVNVTILPRLSSKKTGNFAKFFTQIETSTRPSIELY